MARQEANPAFDAYPALIAECANQADIRIALDIACKAQLSPVCKSGGHSTAGYSVLDGYLVLDLKALNSVRVFPATSTAVIETGAPFGQVNETLDAYGLHVPGGGCADVCIGGYVQDGGYGFTSRNFGMHSDNVRSFRMMLAGGRIVPASRSVNYDLFWAVRGGTGNNFGVLLDVEYDLHPVGTMAGFGLSWDLDDAPAALCELQANYMASGAPRQLGYMLGFNQTNGITRLMMRAIYDGPQADAQAVIDAMCGSSKARLDFSLTGSYNQLDRVLMVRPPFDSDTIKPGAKEDKQSGYIDRMLTVSEWAAVVDYIRAAAVVNFVVIEPYGGRINEIPWTDSAFVHRDAHMDFFVDAFWYDAADKQAAVAWLDGFMALMRPCFNGKSYQNYPRATFKDYPLVYWGEAAYSDLCRVKNKYDPGNVFTFPQAIGRWPGFAPGPGIGCPKLAAAIEQQAIAYEV
jgi:hypothetical protein